MRFSPVRPTVFAATSSEGVLLIYDLQANRQAPVCVLDSLLVPPTAAASSHTSNVTAASTNSAGSDGSKNSKAATTKLSDSGTQRRVGLSSVSFNPKQRDLIASCDVLGRVHIWRLNWSLSNKTASEMGLLNELGNIHQAAEGTADSKSDL